MLKYVNNVFSLNNGCSVKMSTNIYPSKKNIMPQKKKKKEKLLTEKVLLETVSHICLRSVVYNIR